MAMINKRERRDIMLCHPLNMNVVNGWPKPWYVQPKLEGDRCRAVWDPNIGYVLYTSTARPIIFLPHINRALNNLNITEELDGELYNHNYPHELIHGIVSRSKNIHPLYKHVQFHIFDYVCIDAPFETRYKWLNTNIEDSDQIQLVHTMPVEDESELFLWYENYIYSNYEGIIVRNKDAPYVRKRSPFIRKHKPQETDTYLCVGMKEEYSIEGIPKGRMGSLVMMDQDENTFGMGGWTDYEKELYWRKPSSVIGHLIQVRYQAKTELGIPKMITKKEVLL